MVRAVGPGAGGRGVRRWAWVLASALALAGAGWALAVRGPGGPGPPAQRPAAGAPAVEPGVVTEGLHLVGRREGVRQWEADARGIVQGLSGGPLRFREVTNGVLYREGSPYLRFRGDGGRFEETTGRLWLEGVFVLEHGASNRLEARDLEWDAGRQTLVTRQPVRAWGEELSAVAQAMTLDVASGVVHLTGGVVVHQADGSRVAAAAADWHLETGEIVLYGPSTMERRLP